MKPTDILEHEHEVILKMTSIMRKMAQGIEKADNETLGKIIEFIRTFADKCHHAKEEKVLFVEAEKNGIPKEGGPIGMMLVEHDEGRGYVRNMDAALQKIKNGDKSAYALYKENMLNFAQLLEPHIDKENNILYQMINMHIPEEENPSILEKFEKMEKEDVGEGVHEKFHEWVHDLEKQYLNK